MESPAALPLPVLEFDEPLVVIFPFVIVRFETIESPYAIPTSNGCTPRNIRYTAGCDVPVQYYKIPSD
jgi:hypothetical protein